ncbi:MAG TPA: hypothetical protein VFU47_14890, partial [Armatimonadota bacterium]|nr:hypothetical protein [Armatimonadota bacterium]
MKQSATVGAELLHEALLPEAPAPEGVSELFRVIADDLPVGILVTETHSGALLLANRACRSLWRVGAAAEAAELQDAMRVASADPNLVSLLWQERSARDVAEILHSNLVLRDGRKVRWRTGRIETAGVPADLHVFEPVSAPPPPPAVQETDLFQVAFEKAAVGMT